MSEPKCGCRIVRDWDTIAEEYGSAYIIQCPLCKAAPAMLAACEKVIRALDAPEANDPSHRDYKNPAAIAADRSIAEKAVREAVAAAKGRTP